MIFNSYKEAIEHHKITGFALHIQDHPRSLEKILNNGNVIKMIGVGNTSSPGYPSGNQIIYNQEILTKNMIQTPIIPAFHTFLDGKVEFLGNYIFHSCVKKMAFSGFTYFEYTYFNYKPVYAF